MTTEQELEFEKVWEQQKDAGFLRRDNVYMMRKFAAEFFYHQGYQLAQAEIEKLKSELKDYYLTQEKYKESYEYGLKLKAEIEGVREQLQAQCKITHELLDEKAILNHQLIKINQEVATLVEALKYFTGWSRAEQALSEWNKKRGGM